MVWKKVRGNCQAGYNKCLLNKWQIEVIFSSCLWSLEIESESGTTKEVEFSNSLEAGEIY